MKLRLDADQAICVRRQGVRWHWAYGEYDPQRREMNWIHDGRAWTRRRARALAHTVALLRQAARSRR